MLLQKKPSKITKCRRKSPQVTTASSSMVMWCFASPQYLHFYWHNYSKTRKLPYRKLLEFSSILFSMGGVVAAPLTTPLSQVHLADAGTGSFRSEISHMKNAQFFQESHPHTYLAVKTVPEDFFLLLRKFICATHAISPLQSANLSSSCATRLCF